MLSRKGVPRNVKFHSLAIVIDSHSVNVLTECWEWTKRLNNQGYGVTGRGSRINGTHGTMLASRLSWTAFYGDIPVGLNVLHHCDNPRCINPEHLFLGTIADNVQDMMQKGRHNTKRGSQIGTSVLTEEQVREIKSKLAHRNSGKLAREYSVSDSLIDSIRHGRSWKHVQ